MNKFKTWASDKWGYLILPGMIIGYILYIWIGSYFPESGVYDIDQSQIYGGK